MAATEEEIEKACDQWYVLGVDKGVEKAVAYARARAADLFLKGDDAAAKSIRDMANGMADALKRPTTEGDS